MGKANKEAGLKKTIRRAKLSIERYQFIADAGDYYCSQCKSVVSSEAIPKYALDVAKTHIVKCRKCRNEDALMYYYKGSKKKRKGPTGLKGTKSFNSFTHPKKDATMAKVFLASNLGKGQGDTCVLLAGKRFLENVKQIYTGNPNLTNFYSFEKEKKIYKSAAASGAHITMKFPKLSSKVVHSDIINGVMDSGIELETVGLFYFDLCGHVTYEKTLSMPALVKKYGSKNSVVIVTMNHVLRIKDLTKNICKTPVESLTESFSEFSDVYQETFHYNDNRTPMDVHVFELRG